MDVAHHASKHRGTWGRIFLAGVVAGGLLGWIARTFVPTQAWRVPTRPVTPIQVQTYLKGVAYPTGKHGLLARAQAAGADAPVLETLTQLPEQRYTSPIEVSRALGTRPERGAER
jgi:Protein of unknown function (DUF2795)